MIQIIACCLARRPTGHVAPAPNFRPQGAEHKLAMGSGLSWPEWRHLSSVLLSSALSYSNSPKDDSAE
eukprot:9162608-Pyramimonas_sp.AAC.1